MINMQLEVDLKPLQDELTAMQKRIAQFVQQNAATMCANALWEAQAANKDAVPIDSGQLRANTKITKYWHRGFQDRGTVYAGSATLQWRQPYAAAVDAGAAPHRIEGRMRRGRQKMLHWVDPAYGPVWYRAVNHPGVARPSHFSDKVFKAAHFILLRDAGAGLAKALVGT